MTKSPEKQDSLVISSERSNALSTKLIYLTQEKFTIVDETDYDWLTQWKWCFGSNGYAIRSEYKYLSPERKILRMHRIILNAPATMFVDHINRNKLDNRL